MIKEIFGLNLKKLRLNQGLTRECLAEFLDASTTQIYKIESGKSFASAEMIDKIATFFKVPPYKLFMTEEDLNTKTTDFQEAARYIKEKIDILFKNDLIN